MIIVSLFYGLTNQNLVCFSLGSLITASQQANSRLAIQFQDLDEPIPNFNSLKASYTLKIKYKEFWNPKALYKSKKKLMKLLKKSLSCLLDEKPLMIALKVGGWNWYDMLFKN